MKNLTNHWRFYKASFRNMTLSELCVGRLMLWKFWVRKVCHTYPAQLGKVYKIMLLEQEKADTM